MKPRIPAYKNKSFKQRRRKAARLWMYGEAETQEEALYMAWMSNSKWTRSNAARAFSRKGMKKEIERIEKAMIAKEAKLKEQVVAELEENDDKMALAEAKVLGLVDKLADKATANPELVKELTKAVNSLKGLSKIRQDIGTRTDKLQGRYVAEAKNPEDVKNDTIKALMLAQQKGQLNQKEKQADAIDV